MSWSRFLSLIVALTYLVAATVSEDPRAILLVIGFLLFPLACIWFSGPLGSYVGPRPIQYISKPSPSGLVALLGWILLVTPGLLALLLA